MKNMSADNIKWMSWRVCQIGGGSSTDYLEVWQHLTLRDEPGVEYRNYWKIPASRIPMLLTDATKPQLYIYDNRGLRPYRGSDEGE